MEVFQRVAFAFISLFFTTCSLAATLHVDAQSVPIYDPASSTYDRGSMVYFSSYRHSKIPHAQNSSTSFPANSTKHRDLSENDRFTIILNQNKNPHDVQVELSAKTTNKDHTLCYRAKSIIWFNNLPNTGVVNCKIVENNFDCTSGQQEVSLPIQFTSTDCQSYYTSTNH